MCFVWGKRREKVREKGRRVNKEREMGREEEREKINFFWLSTACKTITFLITPSNYGSESIRPTIHVIVH